MQTRHSAACLGSEMHLATNAILIPVALLGHFAITVWLFNRLHALGWPRRIVKTLEKLLLLAALVVAGCLCFAKHNTGLSTYTAFCYLAALTAVPYWLIPNLLEKMPAALLSNHTTTIA